MDRNFVCGEEQDRAEVRRQKAEVSKKTEVGRPAVLTSVLLSYF
jgi:hypothetical protein